MKGNRCAFLPTDASLYPSEDEWGWLVKGVVKNRLEPGFLGTISWYPELRSYAFEQGPEGAIHAD